MSARQKYNGVPVHTMLLTLAHMGPLVTFAAGTLKFVMPARAKIIGLDLNVGARGGTHVTSAVDVQKGGVSILSSTFDIDALTPGTPVSKEIADLAAGADPVAGDAAMSVVATESGGTSPTWGHATLQIDYILI